jgi:O-antigen ligase
MVIKKRYYWNTNSFLMILNAIAEKRIFGQRLPELLAKSAIYIILAGFFCVISFRAFLSIAIITFVVTALIHFFMLSRNRNTSNLQNFLPFIAIFILFALSTLMTAEGNWEYAYRQLILKLQYPAFALAFILLPSFSERTYHHFFLFFFLLVLGTSFISAYHFMILDKGILIDYYSRSGTLYTIIDHVRYSLFICLAIFLGIYLLVKKYAAKTSIVFWLILAGTIYLTLFLHILAVRSGLVAFYVIFIMLSVYFLLKKHYKASIFIVLVIIFSVFFSYKYIDTLRARFGSTMYDLQMSHNLQESGNDYSISRRIISWKVAYSIFREHPVFGVGEGNILSERNKKYAQDYPFIRPEKIMSPHNQYLRQLATTGAVGFIIFMVCFFYPLFYKKNYKHIPLLVIYIIAGISFLVEDTLDIQLGLSFCLFFIMINLHYLKGNPLSNSDAEKDHH